MDIVFVIEFFIGERYILYLKFHVVFSLASKDFIIGGFLFDLPLVKKGKIVLMVEKSKAYQSSGICSSPESGFSI